MGSGTVSRQALTGLAELELQNGQVSQARDRFAAFAQRYPSSDFAWMAAVRVGQAEAVLGRHEAAARTFADAVTKHGHIPLVRVLGAAYRGTVA